MSTQGNRAVFGAPLVTPREVWLASLGAVVITRDWAGKEAGPMFRNLVKEGTIVETRAVRIVGEGLESSFERANAMWRRARTTVTSTVKSAADTAVAIARELPRTLPGRARLDVGAIAPVRKRAARTTKTAKAGARKARRTVKRAAKKA